MLRTAQSQDPFLWDDGSRVFSAKRGLGVSRINTAPMIQECPHMADPFIGNTDHVYLINVRAVNSFRLHRYTPQKSSGTCIMSRTLIGTEILCGLGLVSHERAAYRTLPTCSVNSEVSLYLILILGKRYIFDYISRCLLYYC